MTDQWPATLEIVIKETRHGNLATFKDTDAVSGIRSMTPAETKAQDYITNLISDIDAEQYESGDKLAEVTVPEDGEPTVEWLIEQEVRSA